MAVNLVAVSDTPILQFFSTAGVPLSGGLLSTYVGGLPSATYSDSAGQIPLPNPIILNSRGEVATQAGTSTPMYVTPNVAYTYVLQDASGNTIWTASNITTLPGASFLALVTQTLIGSVLWPQTANEIAAQITPTNYYYPEGNVLRYGADATGVTGSDPAIKAALSVACAASLNVGGVGGLGGHVKVYFPHGQYTVTTSNVFGNPLFPTTIRGIVFAGDGNGASIIYLKTSSSSTLWLFDGTATEGSTGSMPGTQNWLTPTWQDLCFMGDSTAYANGFRSFSSQGGRFLNCYFNNFDVAFDTEAAIGQGYGGDSWLWFYSKFTNIAGACVVFNNGQAFNFHFHGCAMEQITGDVFHVGANGGGGMEVYGGSYIMQCVTQGYLLHIIAGASLGDNNNWFNFNQLAISLQSQVSGLVYCGATGDEAPLITFNSGSVQETGGTSGKETVLVYDAHVVFNGTSLTTNQGSTYLCYGPNSGGAQYGDSGSIIFNQCEVPLNFSTFAETPIGGDSLSWGYISARDCFASSFVSATNRFQRFAIDFDLNWQNVGRAYNVPRLKTAQGYIQNYAWPAVAGSTTNWTINLPSYSTIVAIFVYRPATGSNIAYNLYCGNGTGGASGSTLTYGSVTGSNCNVAQTITGMDWTDTPATWVVTGAYGSASSQVQIWSTAASVTDAEAGAGGGYFLVKYY